MLPLCIIIIGLVLACLFLVLSILARPRPPKYWQRDEKPTINDFIGKCRESAGDDFAAAFQTDIQPCFRLQPAPSDSRFRSKLGGCPEIPPDIDWPQWKGKSLSFVGQIDLTEVPDSEVRSLLPARGMLYLFYAHSQAAGGCDPEHKGSSAVIYIENPPNEHAAVTTPSDRKCLFKEARVQIVADVCTPDLTDYPPFDALDRKQRAAIYELEGEYLATLGGTGHRIFGPAHAVQNADMDLLCQLVTYGIYVGHGYDKETELVKELARSRHEWRLLFQIDNDEDIEMVWGDLGRLYYWIRNEDLKERRFEKVWTIMQCF